MIINKLVQLISLPNTYIGEAAIAVDNCQWVRMNAGVSRVHFSKAVYDKPTFSIYVRAKSNEEASTRIHDVFNKIRNYTDGGCAIVATRLPSFVGKDEKHRSVYTFQIEYQTGGY